MLMRFDPFRGLDRLTQQMWESTGRPAVMPMDAYREGERFTVHFDLPGVDPASVELTVEQNVLTVKAERRWTPAEGAEVVASERLQGSFTRQLFLGDTLDAEHIEAAYDNGVLTVHIPVVEQAKPRRIQIGGGSSHHAISANSTAA